MATKNIPQIRFKGFDGEWEEKKFNDRFLGFTEKTTSENEDVLLSSSINGMFLNSELFSHQRGSSNKGYLKIKLGTMILSAQNLHLGNANVNLRFNHGIISPAYKTYNILEDNIAYVNAWLKRDNTNKMFFDCTTVGASLCRRNIDWDELYNQYISFPPKSEQERIASLFTTLDKQISCSEAKLDKLRTIKKTLLKKMFASQGEKTPQIRFKGFEEEWEEKLLGEIGTINSGCDYKHLNRGNIPVYGTGGYMTSVDKALSYTKDAIGIGRKGTIDNPYILKAPFWTVDTLFYVFPKDNINLNFLFNLYCKVDWRSKNEASGVPSLSKGIINNVCIKTASLSEQTRIASLFTALDKQISCQEKKIEKLKAVKKTLLKKMFV